MDRVPFSKKEQGRERIVKLGTGLRRIPLVKRTMPKTSPPTRLAPYLLKNPSLPPNLDPNPSGAFGALLKMPRDSKTSITTRLVSAADRNICIMMND
jgi:hypothetical protein